RSPLIACLLSQCVKLSSGVAAAVSSASVPTAAVCPVIPRLGCVCVSPAIQETSARQVRFCLSLFLSLSLSVSHTPSFSSLLSLFLSLSLCLTHSFFLLPPLSFLLCHGENSLSPVQTCCCNV